MRNSLTNTIERYLKKCQTSDWIFDEAYKFQFSNFLNNSVDWENQNDDEILEILKKSQRFRYTNSIGRGIQFIIKSGIDLKNIILIEDVINFRKVYNGEQIENVNWSNRGMSFPGLSTWLSTLFPEKLYPVPMKGFNETINFLFDTKNEKLPKTGLDYILNCQPFLKQTERVLKQYPIQEIYLKHWNKYYSELSELGIEQKTEISKFDWVWLVQDFHLFTLREILGFVKQNNENIEIADTLEQSTIEGGSKLATHLKYERDSSFIKRIKKKALENNIMLNCEICGFSFLDIYGKVGQGFIEAHHINPLNEREGKQVTKKEDIALICSNCHRMLHRKINDKLLSMNELKELITRHNKV